MHCFCSSQPHGRHALRIRGVLGCPRIHTVSPAESPNMATPGPPNMAIGQHLAPAPHHNATGGRRAFTPPPQGHWCERRHWSSYASALVTRSVCIETVLPCGMCVHTHILPSACIARDARSVCIETVLLLELGTSHTLGSLRTHHICACVHPPRCVPSHAACAHASFSKCMHSMHDS